VVLLSHCDVESYESREEDGTEALVGLGGTVSYLSIFALRIAESKCGAWCSANQSVPQYSLSSLKELGTGYSVARRSLILNNLTTYDKVLT
jgi:hypothetical protein